MAAKVKRAAPISPARSAWQVFLLVNDRSVKDLAVLVRILAFSVRKIAFLVRNIAISVVIVVLQSSFLETIGLSLIEIEFE